MLKATVLFLASAVFAAACGSCEASDATPVPTTAPRVPSTAPTTTTTIESTSTDTPTTTTEPAPTTSGRPAAGTPATPGTEIFTLDSLEPAAQAWVDLWWLVNERVPEAELRQAATENGSRLLEARLHIGENPPRRLFNLYPSTTTNDDGTVTIDDCVLVTPPVEAQHDAIHYRATAVEADGGWIITDTTIVSTEPCVPASLANEILGDYESYWDGQVEIWSPADPTHPLLFETTAGAHLDALVELLVEFEGYELRGRPQTHPEITLYAAVDRVEIADCQLTDPERGIYEVISGDRAEDIAPPVAGQRDGREITMERVDGRWRVTDRQGSVNINCGFAPTDLGLPQI